MNEKNGPDPNLEDDHSGEVDNDPLRELERSRESLRRTKFLLWGIFILLLGLVGAVGASVTADFNGKRIVRELGTVAPALMEGVDLQQEAKMLGDQFLGELGSRVAKRLPELEKELEGSYRKAVRAVDKRVDREVGAAVNTSKSLATEQLVTRLADRHPSLKKEGVREMLERELGVSVENAVDAARRKRFDDGAKGIREVVGGLGSYDSPRGDATPTDALWEVLVNTGHGFVDGYAADGEISEVAR